MRIWWLGPACLLLVSACGETQGERATTGALGGVAFGAAVGGPIGAIVGGAAGAGVGAERGSIDRTVDTGSQKAESAVGMDKPENTARATEPTPMARSSESPRSAQASNAQVRDAQAKLKSMGLYAGPVDGIYGSRTRAAVTDFQAQNGLTQTGTLTVATEERLRNASTQNAQAPQPANNSPNSVEERPNPAPAPSSTPQAPPPR